MPVKPPSSTSVSSMRTSCVVGAELVDLVGEVVEPGVVGAHPEVGLAHRRFTLGDGARGDGRENEDEQKSRAERSSGVTHWGLPRTQDGPLCGPMAASVDIRVRARARYETSAWIALEETATAHLIASRN